MSGPDVLALIAVVGVVSNFCLVELLIHEQKKRAEAERQVRYWRKTARAYRWQVTGEEFKKAMEWRGDA